MTIRKILCIAAAICLLWTAATADGYGYNYNYGAPVDLIQYSAIPYHWEVQPRFNGQEMTWRVQNLQDGIRSTKMEHTCWNNESLDDEPEISFYFSGATIKDLWIRNAYDNTDELYNQYARPFRIDVTVWIGNAEEPLGPYVYTRIPDVWDSTALNTESYDGYRCLSLPQRFENVTRVDLWIKGWHKGDDAFKTKYMLHISDLAFLPDTITRLYGTWIFDPANSSSYNYNNNYYWTPTPTLVPTAVPTIQPYTTPVSFTGLQILTKERLATRSGPGTNYTGSGSYFQAGTWVKALSAAYDSENGIWWIQVELTYNGELRRVYTGVQRLQMMPDQVPIEEEQGGAVVTRSVYGYWGPGYGYSMYGDRIPAGTTGTVWQREGSYAQFEYYDEGEQAYRRVWVPENALEEVFG